MNSIAERIGKIKEEFKLNNVELGKLAGVSKAAVGKWVNEGATPNSEAAVNIRERLGINESWLINGKGVMLANAQPDNFTNLLTEITDHLPDSQKDEVLEYARYLATKNVAQEK